ncbi:hypothetical protein C8R41DRAFT_861957 [Lentinula lateritia]|uniref:Uncharacterized protein n=1 Tax=Lentinula lateritia TaxID=40482 RepID=A0ABQ8V032_9AGAR|nr:hypothetical protein C8R41DRAFT_861957 [Lentinula lateritia]
MRLAHSLRLTIAVLSFACAAFAAPVMKLETGKIIGDGPTNVQDNINSSISQRGIFHICSVTFDQARHVTEVATVDSKANDLAQQWVVRLLQEEIPRAAVCWELSLFDSVSRTG